MQRRELLKRAVHTGSWIRANYGPLQRTHKTRGAWPVNDVGASRSLISRFCQSSGQHRDREQLCSQQLSGYEHHFEDAPSGSEFESGRCL